MQITKFMETRSGSIFISILLGLGLASMFHFVCKKDSCMVIKAPPLKELDDYYYKIDNTCYKYKPYVTKCDKK